MAKSKINAMEMIADIRAGTDDHALMQKYCLSAQGLQSAFKKLLSAGVVTQADLDRRTPFLERTVEVAWTCPACKLPQAQQFDECPNCGIIVSKYNARQGAQQEADRKSVRIASSPRTELKRNEDPRKPEQPQAEAKTEKKAEQKTEDNQSKNVMGGCLVLVVLFVCIWAVWGLFSSSKPKPPTPSAQTSVEARAPVAEPAIRVDRGKLCNDYYDNEVNADQRYKGRVLEVSGPVGNIGKDVMDTMYITFHTDSTNLRYPRIQAYFAKEHVEQIAALKKRDIVTVRGRCKGKMMNVLLLDCTLVP